MTNSQLLIGLLEFYADSQALIAVPEEALGQIAVQYQETDWAFLNRMLSHYGSLLDYMGNCFQQKPHPFFIFL